MAIQIAEIIFKNQHFESKLKVPIEIVHFNCVVSKKEILGITIIYRRLDNISHCYIIFTILHCIYNVSLLRYDFYRWKALVSINKLLFISVKISPPKIKFLTFV